MKKLKKKINLLKIKSTELENLEKAIKDKAIKPLSNYSDKDKIKYFDKLYNTALEELVELEKTGEIDEDSKHYAWGNYITILAKKNKIFWKYWESLIN